MPPVELSELQRQAEARLGRSLTRGELAIDLAADDHALEAGKAELRAAIEEEKARAIRATLRTGRMPVLRVTPRMLRALRRLLHAGRAAAAREIAAHGVEAPQALAVEDDDLRLGRVLAILIAHLAAISHRVNIGATDALTGAELTPTVRNALGRALIRRVSGPLAAAADLVSPAFLAGLADGYAPSLNAFPSWTYTAIMDAATCDPCAYYDGQVFDSFDAIQEVLPDGGPNPDCEGGSRCRCRPSPNPD